MGPDGKAHAGELGSAVTQTMEGPFDLTSAAPLLFALRGAPPCFWHESEDGSEQAKQRSG